jgi:hypothetical protein
MRSGMGLDASAIKEASEVTLAGRTTGPWLKPFMAPFQKSSIEYPEGAPEDSLLDQFEKGSTKARQRLALTPNNAVFVKRSELEAAIAEAVTDLNRMIDSKILPPNLMNMRRGLQMFGVHVQKDDAQDNSPLRLANLDLPFSLRFIACSFEMPLSLSSASMVTLDLSGCAVPGIDATFLRLAGSLRLRRLYSSAPLDFTGARIHGFLDGADMLLQPFGPHPSEQAVSPERAMLGLNQAQIDNEIRMQRAQIWGGITMRGLEAKRSIYMSDAVVLSPLAVLEAMAKAKRHSMGWLTQAAEDKIYKLPGTNGHDENQSSRTPDEQKINRSRQNMSEWKKETWLRGWSDEFSGVLEDFDDKSSKWKSTTLNALLSSNLRARTSAIRADGLKIAGSVFMERLVSHGRLRAKYAQIAGGLSLTGAHLRSTEALMPTFDRLWWNRSIKAKRIREYRLRTYKDLVDPEDSKTGELARGSDIYALDLRESRIEGDVRIGITDLQVPEEAGWSTRIDGSVTFDQAEFDGKLLLERVIFKWSQRLPKPEDRSGPKNEADYQKLLGVEEEKRTEKLKNGREHQFSARGLTTADTTNLSGCRNLKGANFSNAIIGGDLLFYAGWEHPKKGDVSNREMLQLEAPAKNLDGASIDLSGAEISGDLRLLFHPGEQKGDQNNDLPSPGSKRWGPSIHAERMTVRGLLSIMPTGDEGGLVDVSVPRYCEVVDASQIDRLDQRTWAARDKETWQREFSARRARHPQIDLAVATATLLEFPPPAWPKAGLLLVAGFAYQRALPQGPLAPHPSGRDTHFPKRAQEITSLWESVAWISFVAAFYNFFIFQIFEDQQKFFASSSFYLTPLFLIAAAYIAIPIVISPRAMQIVPMALAWLELQPAGRNSYRTKRSLTSKVMFWRKPSKGNLFRSLEPYTVAADALRREGRWVSANLVEQERFRVRNWQLSWRIHLLQKVSFWLADIMTEYGYNFARLLFFTALTVILATMTVEKAEEAGVITPKVHRVNVAWLHDRPAPDPKRAFPKNAPLDTSSLDKLMFAADTVLPVMDLGELSDWEVKKGYPALRCAETIPFLRAITYSRLLSLYHTIGLVLAGIFLLGLSTRFSHWLARYGD